MEQKYTELNHIKLDELECFFSTPARKIISQMNVSTLGELLSLSETKEFINYFIYDSSTKISPLYQEIVGTLKLLKFKFLGIDPKINEKFTLEELGISSRASNGILRYKHCVPFKAEEVERFYAENNIIELINHLSNEQVLKESFSKTRTVGVDVVKEVQSKFIILKQYFDGKEKSKGVDSSTNVTNDELKQLYIELEELLKQQSVLNEQILIIQNRINEKSLEASNESNRKK